MNDQNQNQKKRVYQIPVPTRGGIDVAVYKVQEWLKQNSREADVLRQMETQDRLREPTRLLVDSAVIALVSGAGGVRSALLSIMAAGFDLGMEVGKLGSEGVEEIEREGDDQTKKIADEVDQVVAKGQEQPEDWFRLQPGSEVIN